MFVLDCHWHRIRGEDLGGCGNRRSRWGVFLDRTAAADEQPQHQRRQSQSNQLQAVHGLFSSIADNISADASTFDFATALALSGNARAHVAGPPMTSMVCAFAASAR